MTTTRTYRPRRHKVAGDLDRTAFRILECLSKEPHATNSGIARQINVSEETVRRRLNVMEANGVIKRSVEINPASIGLNVVTLVLIDCARNHTYIVRTYLRQRSEVQTVLELDYSEFSVMAICAFANNQQRRESEAAIQDMDTVRRLTSIQIGDDNFRVTKLS